MDIMTKEFETLLDCFSQQDIEHYLDEKKGR